MNPVIRRTNDVDTVSVRLGQANDRTRLAQTVVVAGVLAAALPGGAHRAPSAPGDFDGDGRSDLAVGAPMDSVAGGRGLAVRDELFCQGSPECRGRPSPSRTSLGSRAPVRCIRMSVPALKRVYRLVPVGARMMIE